MLSQPNGHSSPLDWSLTPSVCSSESGGNDTCSPLPAASSDKYQSPTLQCCHMTGQRAGLPRPKEFGPDPAGLSAQEKWAPSRTSCLEGWRPFHCMTALSGEEARSTGVTRFSRTCPSFPLFPAGEQKFLSLAFWEFSQGGRTTKGLSPWEMAGTTKVPRKFPVHPT